MLYKVYKIIFANMEKEEAWLNEMAEKGFNFLDNFFIRYTFTESTPNEYVYRIELLKQKASHPVNRQYIRFLEETGVECVSTSGRWAYFRKKAADGPFDLYSDIDAKIDHYKRIISYVATILFFNLIVLGLNITIILTKNVPSYIAVTLGVLVFTGILIKSLVHHIMKIKRLKEDKQVHE